ncbi:MAG TPA: transcription termination factor NusA [bacterium]|nr:transcription termination factor NusA [bacterium]HPQ67255.1 transcription termination factor NusA [bacterium]
MNRELLAFFEYMEKDKGVSREVLIEAIETAIISASKKAVESARDLEVTVDPETGDIRASACLIAVEKVEDRGSEISLSDARTFDPAIKVGDEVRIPVPTERFGRIAAQTAKQVVMQKIREAEKEVVRETFQERTGELASGIVRRIERQTVFIDLDRTEAILPFREQCPQEEYHLGMRLRALILEVKDGPRGPEVIFSRSNPDFVRRLFEMEVPEIEQGVVQIKAIAREAGYRTKLAVWSDDPRVDCVGACVGIRGSRVKSVVRELNGEKIDIIRWDADPVTYITNALSPAKLKRVTIDETKEEAEVIVDEDQLSLAIGRKGQNVRLSSRLTGWQIDIYREGEVLKDVKDAIGALSRLPEVDTALARALVEAGFTGVPVLAISDKEDLLAVPGVDEETAERIIASARDAVAAREKNKKDRGRAETA